MIGSSMAPATLTTPAVEEWRPVKGFEGLYEVSNHGRVRSLDRVVEKIEWNGKKYQRLYRGKILYINLLNTGYCSATLCIDGRCENIVVHRLVAQAFIPNPDNLPCVNHKDECKSNNHADNLEWCTYSYNNRYNDKNKRVAMSKSKPIEQLSLTGEHIAFFPSATIAARILNVRPQHISGVALGIRKVAYGYRWRFVKSKDIKTLKPMGKKQNRPANARIEQLTLQGEHVAFFDGRKQVAKTLGYNITSIWEALNGWIKSSHGYKWRYVDN